MFKLVILMKSLRTSIDRNSSTFTDDDIQKIMSTAIFFPANKNKFGSPRNFEEVRVEDKFILNKLYIKGFEDWKFDETYLFNFIVDFMDLRSGGTIRTLSVPDIIKETLREIGTEHFYDLQFICNQIHMIFDCVSFYDYETKCVLSELKNDDGDSEMLPTSVLNYMQTSDKINIPINIYEKMMRDIQNDNTFSIYEYLSKYKPPIPLRDDDDCDDCDDNDDAEEKDIEIYPLMILNKNVPLTVEHRKYHEKLIKCLFKTFNIFRLDLCCDTCKKTAFNM
nr:MAG: hypothetical protein [Porcellio scaber clopovirus]